MQGNIFRFAEMYFIYSAIIYKATGLTVPGRSMISTGTNPMEQKSVHWLSMGPPAGMALGGEGAFRPPVFWGTAGNKGASGL